MTCKITWMICWNICQLTFSCSQNIGCKECHPKKLTWSISIQASDVIEHKTEETREQQKDKTKMFEFRVFLKISILWSRMKKPELRADLQLVLFTGIFNRLKDVPGVPPPHLQVGHVTPEPSLDQHSCLYTYRKTVTGKHLESCAESKVLALKKRQK